MKPPTDGTESRLRPAVLLLLAAAFAVAHTQAPLYYSNQSQYFLHGLAHGGRGYLDSDWLANTADPTPIFSATVAWTYWYVGEWPFQAMYFAMLMVYFVGTVVGFYARRQRAGNEEKHITVVPGAWSLRNHEGKDEPIEDDQRQRL